jgi:hypothetical protein
MKRNSHGEASDDVDGVTLLGITVGKESLGCRICVASVLENGDEVVDDRCCLVIR